ncbi:hypothetical protein HDR58_08260 [bacterium]|nr:hypothetical protein [bacterium]
MQEFISFIKYLANSNTINFIIMLIILGFIVVKLNLKSSLDNSISTVESSIKKSDDEKENSEKVLATSQLQLERLPQDIDNLEKEAQSKAQIFKEKIEESTKKNIEGIKNNIDRAISIEEKKISNLLTGKTIVASVEMAKEQMKQLLTSNPELHGKFIEESLDELDKVKL